MLKIVCVIPSRIGSTRLPRKPLLPINGKPMVQVVYENALKCNCFSQVIVATDSEEIAQVITSVGGSAVLTASDLACGSDRVAAVARTLKEADIIVNLQGDQPFIQPLMLEQLLLPYLHMDLSSGLPDMATLAASLDPKEHQDPGVVKVITDINSNALYFSRAPIPYNRTQPNMTLPVYHHIGLYAFRREFLLKFTELPATPLEIAESLEQLRALEHGFKIRVSLTNIKTWEVNTPEDYELAKNVVA